MIMKSTCFVMFWIAMSAQIWACDGCGTSSNSVGMFSAYRNNFVGLGLQKASFVTTSNHKNAMTDHFYQLNLTARYYVTDRFKVLLNVPYALHIRKTEVKKNGLNGLADTQIIGSYSILQDFAISEQISLFGELNGGLKLPTGSYNNKIYEHNLPENFNLGTGSWSGIAQANLIFSYRNAGGLQISGSYQHNSLSKGGYHFGHQWNTEIMFFTQQNFINESKFIAQIGCLSEKTASDKYANRKFVPNTGDTGSFALAALNFKTEKWLAGYSYALPFANNYADGQVKAKARSNFQISFIF